MSILNCLNVPFPLTPETATTQAALIKTIEAHNADCDSISKDEADLKATPDSSWTPGHSKSVAKLRDRKLESLHGELRILNEIGDFLTRVLTVDFHAAQSAADAAVEDAKRKATEHLVAGGWMETRTEISDGVFLLPIDLTVLIRNREVCQAMLTAQAMKQASLIEVRKMNADAIEKAKERFAAVKSKAMALQV